MDTSPTELYLPHTLPYPISVVSIDAQSNSTVDRGTRLLSYSFQSQGSTRSETRFGTWDSAIQGTLSAWRIKPGDIISQKRAREKHVVVVIEPCKHGMQIGGLCVLCGKDMTNVDYTGFSDASRASIQMTHSAYGPTVSLEEAQRIEKETADHLLKSRKLSLIVDLDQTIVHATVDPTVGEWINEGEAWEARQAKKPCTSIGTPRPSDNPDASPDEECNPNWEALKDVKRFRLGPESFGPPSIRDIHRGKGKHKMVETEGCMYYIKPRPGWNDFLRETATKYEMHVYTMGTRAYAEEVCSAIDPEGSIFGGRVLSRDESGSLTQKSLQRLFPCDTSMVVIIDDRADVWEWSPNLLKVIPYEFFIGIGDINSSFLPKIEPTPLSVPAQPSTTTLSSEVINGNGLDATAAETASTHPVGVDTTPTTPTPAEEEIAELQTNAMLTRNNAALDAQLEERPLAKKERELQEHEVQEQEHLAAASTSTSAAEVVETAKLPSPKSHKKALLKNDDFELDRIGKLLNEVHSRFFDAYEARLPRTARRKTISSKAHDVTHIIPRLRSEVFEGVHILFSSVIPLDTVPITTEIWRMAHMFGARCSTELTSDITHVVAAKRGTVKVDMARKRGGIKIVWLAWFTDSIALWRRQDEKPYLLDDPPILPPSNSPTLDIHHYQHIPSSSSLEDIIDDSDDWDQEPSEMKDTATLALDKIDWADINDEVDAAMNESDDEWSEQSAGGRGLGSGNTSEEEASDGTGTGSVRNTPTTLKRKRFRSRTPSDCGTVAGANGSTSGARDEDDYLRSPLSKRKKLAADRSGFSRLKEGMTADELEADVEVSYEPAEPEREPDTGLKDETSSNGSSHSSPKTALQEVSHEREGDGDDEHSDDDTDSDEDSDDSNDDDEEEEEDDFLARELEEEMG